MKHGLQRLVSGFLMLAILISLTPFAMAADKAGMAIDLIIPPTEELLTGTLVNVFDANDLTISKESFIGKSGTIYFNADKSKIMLMGEESQRTYAFTDETFFAMAVATFCFALDTADGLDYGIKVYYVSDSETERLSEDDISDISAMLTSLLNE